MTDLNAALTAAACVVIVTDHDAYDWASVRRAARLRVDTRHVPAVTWLWYTSDTLGRYRVSQRNSVSVQMERGAYERTKTGVLCGHRTR